MLTRMEPVVLEIAEGAASSDPDVGLRAVACNNPDPPAAVPV